MLDVESCKMIMKWAMLNFCSVRQQLTTSWRIITERHFRIPLYFLFPYPSFSLPNAFYYFYLFIFRRVENISQTMVKMIRSKNPKQCQREFFASDYDDMVSEAEKLALEVEGTF
jgi:hypothetical protein